MMTLLVKVWILAKLCNSFCEQKMEKYSTVLLKKKDQAMYENFMVCNYGVGVASKTTCDGLTNKKAVISSKNETETTVIKYYTVTSEVIKDVKACLEAVRCRRRRRKFLRTFTTDTGYFY